MQQLWKEILQRAKEQGKEDLPDTSSNLDLGERGWKDRYYQSKLKISLHDPQHASVFQALKQHYAEGLQWVML